jgi:LysM repeat protein
VIHSKFSLKKDIYKKSFYMRKLLNEEIDQIKYLLNYNRGLTLSEQKNNSLINEDTAPGGLGGKWDPSTGEYTIVKGDTLSKIGKAFGVKWMDIWEENKDTLRSGQPNCGRYCGYNWIFVGEVVTIPGKMETPEPTDTTDTTSTEPTDTTTNTTDTTSTEPTVVPITTTDDEESKTKREIRKDCKDEAKKQGLKRFTKERREFMRKCKAEGGTNAESDEENTPTEDKQTGKEKRQERRKVRRDCRAEAKSKNLKGKEKREFIKKCKDEGGTDTE